MRFDAEHVGERRRVEVAAASPAPPMPALQTSASSPPKRSMVAATARSASAATPVSADDREAVDLRGDASIGSARRPGHRDRVPVRGEAPRDRGPDPRPAARDESDLV